MWGTSLLAVPHGRPNCCSLSIEHTGPSTPKVLPKQACWATIKFPEASQTKEAGYISINIDTGQAGCTLRLGLWLFSTVTALAKLEQPLSEKKRGGGGRPRRVVGSLCCFFIFSLTRGALDSSSGRTVGGRLWESPGHFQRSTASLLPAELSWVKTNMQF